MYIRIQIQIAGQLHSFKSNDSITYPDEVVNHTLAFIIPEFIGFTRDAVAKFAAQGQLRDNHVAQSESTKTM